MMTRIRQFVVLAVLVAIGGGSGLGCAPAFEDTSCQTDGDCFSDEQCIQGVCRLAAGPDADSGGETSEAEPASLEMSPKTVEVAVNRQVKLEATVTDADGNQFSGQGLHWKSSKPDVAGVVLDDESGKPEVIAVKGRSTGSATITARLGDVTASAEVTVVEQSVERV
ncbi:MAG: Ig domain-containing protein, partial [Bradymonadaceae bacterium]